MPIWDFLGESAAIQTSGGLNISDSGGISVPGGGVIYLLLDQFTTPLAAGSVNGTLAEPTGQARTVTDTNSKLSITGGVATFASGGAGNGDPGLWYPTMTTVAGMMLIVTMTPGNSTDGGAFGWDSDQSGLIQNAIRFANGALNYNIAGTGVAVGVFTISVPYKLIIIQRGNGGYWALAKGGSQYPSLTLVWMNTTGAAGALFPGVGNAGNAFTVDNMRVPQDRYIPSPLAYDTFTR